MFKNIILIFLLASAGLPARAQQETMRVAQFIPDTSISDLALINPSSIKAKIGDQTGRLTEDDKASRVKFTNSARTEYLILYHLAGSNANAFNEFEVGKLENKNDVVTKLATKSFRSETGVKLGWTLAKLIATKGPGFTKMERADTTMVTYTVEDENSPFLKGYHMPLYKAAYYFKNDRLIRFVFGFPNL